MGNLQKKSIFLIRNLARGIVWLGVIIALFFIFKKYVDANYLKWLAPLYERPILVFLIFTISEIIIGIIPPEIFMLWGLRDGVVTNYIYIIFFLAVISYLAGIIGYFFGSYLDSTRIYRFLRRKFLSKSQRLLNTYGLYLIIVAALTPLPFSGVSMLVGSVNYPLRKYLFYSTTRFIRFGLYGWIIWEANVFG
jgi:membrane protein DedA with SNARE-associated domain